jgi:multidrug efflux system membrane fusion protein
MVYVVNAESKAEFRQVKVIRAAGDQLLLAEGVRAGETVVTDGQLRLVPGAKVEAKKLSTIVPNMVKPGEEPKAKAGEEPKS